MSSLYRIEDFQSTPSIYGASAITPLYPDGDLTDEPEEERRARP